MFEKLSAVPYMLTIMDIYLTYIVDGDTRGCRLLHAFFAKHNPEHCPHISFEAEKDVNGLVKCHQSKQTTVHILGSLFSEQQLDMFTGNLFDLGETGIDIRFEACPS